MDKMTDLLQSKPTGLESAMAAPSQQTGIMGFFKSKKLVVTISLIVTIIIGFAVIWIIYNLIKFKTVDRRMYIVPETENPILGTVATTGNGSGIPEASNGKRFTFSFWIYIHNLDRNSGLMKHVIHRGEASGGLQGSPSVYMDPTLNKLYVFFGKTNPDDTTLTTISDPPTGLANESDFVKVQYYAAKRGITIDYVPLQRWVHVGIVVNETVNNGIISSYIDGELVKTKTQNKIITITGDYKGADGTTPVITYEVTPKLINMSLDRKGNIYVGGSDSSGSGVGFAGLVSLIQFFNYDLNNQDMYKIYTQGPVYLTAAGKLANSIGLGGIVNQYGVRNPLYKKPQLLD